MSRLILEISDETRRKLEAVAARGGKSPEQTAELALREYIENFEDIYKTDLCAVDNLERAFFLSIGE